jgi:carboxylesterase
MDAFKESRADEWIDAARKALMSMRARHDAVSVTGLSMGAALAAIIAAGDRQIPALILIAPYLGMPRTLRFAAATHWLWGRFAGEINARNPRSIRDASERERNLAYGFITGRMLFELSKVVRRARGVLPQVTAPTLIIQSREDPRVSPEVGESALDRIGATEKQLVWTEGAGHIITVDYGRERVFSEVERWLRRHESRARQPLTSSKAAVDRP